MWAGAWPKFIPATLQSASFFIHLAKMDIHEDRWPRHLHLVHLVLPTVHLLRRSRSQHRAGAPAPIAAPRWQGGLRGTYQPRLAQRSSPGHRTRSTQEMDGGENKVDEMKVARPPVFVKVHLRKVAAERRRL